MLKALIQSDYLQHSPYHLNCDDCPRQQKCFEWGKSDTGYKYEGKPIAGIATVDGVENWEWCPIAYLRLPSVGYALDLYNQGKVFGTLQGWPDQFASWVVKFVTELHVTIERVNSDRLTRELR